MDRYDGYADWYDAWAQSAGGVFMATARALEELVAEGSGLAVDVGCGTGLHADVVRRCGFSVLGLDYSADQLRLARHRLPVIRADAGALPLRSGSARLVFSMLTHTDLEGFDRLVAESVRVLAPGGAFVYVGVHPCFVNPFAEHLADGVRLHPGYRQGGWQAPTAFTGSGVRRRVGVHHLSLEQLLTALLHPDAPLDRITERGGGVLPEVLAVRLRRRQANPNATTNAISATEPAKSTEDVTTGMP
jgi:SAM-dependent methyltransferase